MPSNADIEIDTRRDGRRDCIASNTQFEVFHQEQRTKQKQTLRTLKLYKKGGVPSDPLEQKFNQ